jgi:tetratricopeptide (TPR) repeat protein
MTRLASIVADLAAGRVSVAEARTSAAEVPDLDEFDAWKADLKDLLTAVATTKDAARAGDLAEVARAALGLVTDEISSGLLLQLGEHLVRLGNRPAALACFDAVTGRGAQSRGTALAWSYHLETLRQLGRTEEALALVPRALGHVVAGGHRDMQIWVLLTQGRLHRRRGELAEAVDALREAAELRRALPGEGSGASPSLYQVLTELGECARLDGHFDEAIGAFEQARTAAQSANDPHDAAVALSELGHTWRNAGEVERGTKLLGKAAEEARLLGDVDNAARWSMNFDAIDLETASLATRLQRAGTLIEVDPEAAIPLARECVKAGVQLDDAYFEASARIILGAALVKLGRTFQAQAAFRTAFTAATRTSDLTLQFHALANLADELFRDMRRSQFEEASARAVDVGERLRRSAGSGETRQMVASALARVYDRLAVMSAVTYTRADGSGDIPPDPARAIDISQRMRGRNLLRWLSMRPHLDSADPATRGAIIALRAADITVEANAGEADAVLRDLIEQRAAAQAALPASGPGELLALATGSEPIVLGLSELAGTLRPGELLVDVMSLMDNYVVTCVAADGRATTIAFGGTQQDRRAALVALRAARERLREADYAGDVPRAGAEYAAARAPVDEVVRDVADAVAQTGPVERIFLTPQMELFALPWWMLADRLGDIEICVLPVPGALPLLRARPPGTAPLGRLLLIPDATGTLRNPAADVAHVRHDTCDGDMAAILRALPGASALHFGGHGHFDPRNAYFSGFLVRRSGAQDPLSRPDPREPQDPHIALLTAAQLVARVDVPSCELAVLAACRTGIPRQHGANEFTSLPSAMLLTGARAVVASLWDTSDPAVAVMMQEFYAGVTAGQSPATALATARRTLGALSRDDVIGRLGTEEYIPKADPPFGRDIYTDAFQYYGTE